MLRDVMKKVNSKKSRKRAFKISFDVITPNRILSMQILDSDEKIRFLYDPVSRLHVVFNGAINQTHWSKSYQQAERFFNYLVTHS